MQRTFLNASSRSCLNANGSIPSRCTADLTIKRSFGNGKRKHKPSSLNTRSRDKQVKAAGEQALAAKYERNLYNREYRERRKEQAEAKQEKEDDARTYEVANIYRRAMKQPAKDALKAMKEDWALGPLAPKRDVGERAGKLGTVDMGLHQLHALTKTQREDVKARMGDNLFKPHDRVVVLSGRDRGRIGNILEISEERMSATIEGVGKIAVHVPKYMAAHDSDDRTFRVMRRDIRLDELKLVLPVRDPSTGKLKDVVLEHMDLEKVLVRAEGKTAEIEAGHDPLKVYGEDEKVERTVLGKKFELEDYKWKTLRFVPGTQTEIVDHSEKDEEHDWEADYGPNDTLGIAVDERSYFPEIVEKPFKSSILHEISLRDRKEITRYSEGIEDSIKARAEAKMRKQLELEDKVRTPLMELKGELRREQLKANKERKREFEGKTVKTKGQQKEDVMVTIGRAMARNWASNPSVVTGNRRQLLEEVLAQEGAVSTGTPSDART